MKNLSAINENKDLVNKEYVDNGLGEKQPTLVSGANIKTINSQSVLGSGDLSISGEALPVGSEIDYDGQTIPTGWEQINPSYGEALTIGRGGANFSISTAWSTTIIPLTGWNVSTTTRLTNNQSGGIVIGSGISVVEVSAACCIDSSAHVGKETDLTIAINGQTFGRTYYNKPAQNLSNTAIAPLLISVSEGDLIQLAIISGVTGTIANKISYLTVKVIK